MSLMRMLAGSLAVMAALCVIHYLYSHERNAELMWALLGLIQKERGLPERGSWTLAGHSMGGEIVIRMAKQRPETARQVILAAGAVVGRRPHPPPWLRFPPARQWAVVMIEIFSRRPAVIRRVLGSAYCSFKTNITAEEILVCLTSYSASGMLKMNSVLLIGAGMIFSHSDSCIPITLTHVVRLFVSAPRAGD